MRYPLNDVRGISPGETGCSDVGGCLLSEVNKGGNSRTGSVFIRVFFHIK